MQPCSGAPSRINYSISSCLWAPLPFLSPSPTVEVRVFDVAVLIVAMVSITMRLATVALGAAATAAATCDQSIYKYTDTTFLPLQSNAGSPDLFPMPACNGFKLEEASIDQMQDAMKNGTLTSVDLTLCYLMRDAQTRQYLR